MTFSVVSEKLFECYINISKKAASTVSCFKRIFSDLKYIFSRFLVHLNIIVPLLFEMIFVQLLVFAIVITAELATLL